MYTIWNHAYGADGDMGNMGDELKPALEVATKAAIRDYEAAAESDLVDELRDKIKVTVSEVRTMMAGEWTITARRTIVTITREDIEDAGKRRVEDMMESWREAWAE